MATLGVRDVCARLFYYSGFEDLRKGNFLAGRDLHVIDRLRRNPENEFSTPEACVQEWKGDQDIQELRYAVIHAEERLNEEWKQLSFVAKTVGLVVTGIFKILFFLVVRCKGLVSDIEKLRQVSPLIKKEGDGSGFKIEFKEKNFPLVSRYSEGSRLAFIYRVEPCNHTIVGIPEAEGREFEETVKLLRDSIRRSPEIRWSDEIPNKEKFQQAIHGKI